MKLTAAVLAASLIGTAAAKDADYIVVGAGIGGLAAARRILDKDTTGKTVLVLEAQGRTGGRLFTSDKLLTTGEKHGAGDIGASWIHGADPENHPIKVLSSRMDAAGLGGVVETPDNYVYWSNDGTLLSEAETEAAQTAWDDLHTAVIEDAANAASDGSIESFIAASDDHKAAFSDPFVQSICVDNLEFQYGASIKRISGKHSDDDRQFDGPEEVWAKGYQSLADALQNGKLHTEADITTEGPALNVNLNEPVTKVEKTDGNDGNVKVTTGSGANAKFYTADKVILNVPLGVLKAGSIVFDPALDTAKTGSIQKLGFGNVVKMFLRFDQIFWPKDTEHMFMARAVAESTDGINGPIDETHRGMFREFVNTAVVSNEPTVITFAIGGAADVAELAAGDSKLPNDNPADSTGRGCGVGVDANGQEITDIAGNWCVQRAMESLKTMFPTDEDGASTADRTVAKALISNWRSNEYFQGAYTFLAPDATLTDDNGTGDVENAAKPDYDGNLHFVGEHTSVEGFIGTVHGAYLSGIRVADEILGEATDDSITNAVANSKTGIKLVNKKTTAAPTTAPTSTAAESSSTEGGSTAAGSTEAGSTEAPTTAGGSATQKQTTAAGTTEDATTDAPTTKATEATTTKKSTTTDNTETTEADGEDDTTTKATDKASSAGRAVPFWMGMLF